MTEPSCQPEPAGRRLALAGPTDELKDTATPVCVRTLADVCQLDACAPLSGAVRSQANFGRS